ncbi:hypothetical protein PIB30_065980 [Stylosanthes scabra]|uniref:Uncharacterized protein n=1 Tax=Stylosanthes scabra TaxID=79078 RepID=A0ABU6YL15_9FABA|nr:hypothetical protein [Stylosanthes scabra]
MGLSRNPLPMNLVNLRGRVVGEISLQIDGGSTGIRISGGGGGGGASPSTLVRKLRLILTQFLCSHSRSSFIRVRVHSSSIPFPFELQLYEGRNEDQCWRNFVDCSILGS